MSESTYQFAPEFANETLAHESYSKVVTAENLNDEDVKFFSSKAGGSRKDLFVKKGETTAKPEPATEVMPNNSLVPETDLKAEQDAHLITNEKLTASESALDAEKEAHEATKSQLSEVQKQLTEAKSTIEKLSAKKAKTTSTPAPGDAHAEGDAAKSE